MAAVGIGERGTRNEEWGVEEFTRHAVLTDLLWRNRTRFVDLFVLGAVCRDLGIYGGIASRLQSLRRERRS